MCIVFGFYSIKQVELDVAKMKWMPEHGLAFART